MTFYLATGYSSLYAVFSDVWFSFYLPYRLLSFMASGREVIRFYFFIEKRKIMTKYYQVVSARTKIRSSMVNIKNLRWFFCVKKEWK